MSRASCQVALPAGVPGSPIPTPVKANQRETPTASGEGGRGVAGRSFPAENRREAIQSTALFHDIKSRFALLP
jgi:hypothetical protein